MSVSLLISRSDLFQWQVVLRDCCHSELACRYLHGTDKRESAWKWDEMAGGQIMGRRDGAHCSAWCSLSSAQVILLQMVSCHWFAHGFFTPYVCDERFSSSGHLDQNHREQVLSNLSYPLQPVLRSPCLCIPLLCPHLSPERKIIFQVTYKHNLTFKESIESSWTSLKVFAH